MWGWAANDVAARSDRRRRLRARRRWARAAARRLDERIARSGEFVAARTFAAGEQAFIDMWEVGGGRAALRSPRPARYAEERARIAEALA